jgi:hypothetical protein
MGNTSPGRGVAGHTVNAWAGDSFRLWEGKGLTPGQRVNLSLEDENGDGILTISGMKLQQLACLHDLIGRHLDERGTSPAEAAPPDREAG